MLLAGRVQPGERLAVTMDNKMEERHKIVDHETDEIFGSQAATAQQNAVRGA